MTSSPLPRIHNEADISEKEIMYPYKATFPGNQRLFSYSDITVLIRHQILLNITCKTGSTMRRNWLAIHLHLVELCLRRQIPTIRKTLRLQAVNERGNMLSSYKMNECVLFKSDVTPPHLYSIVPHKKRFTTSLQHELVVKKWWIRSRPNILYDLQVSINMKGI